MPMKFRTHVIPQFKVAYGDNPIFFSNCTGDMRGHSNRCAYRCKSSNHSRNSDIVISTWNIEHPFNAVPYGQAVSGGMV